MLALCVGMFTFVLVKAWPSFSANGLGWFGNGHVERQLEDIFKSPADSKHYVREIGALPLLVGTFITTAAAVVLGLIFSLFTAVFIVEFAPAVAEPRSWSPSSGCWRPCRPSSTG